MTDTIVFKEEIFWQDVDVLESHPDRKLMKFYPYCMGSRGYAAVWEVDAEKLFLLKVSGDLDVGNGYVYEKEALKHIFPDSNGERVFADWFTGKIKIEMMHHRPSEELKGNGFDRFKDWVLEFKKGELINEYKADNNGGTSQRIISKISIPPKG